MRAVFRLVVAAFLAIAGMPLMPVNAGVDADMEVGIDRMFGDFANFDLPSADPAECKRSCDANGGCVAWTFVKPGVQGPGARCWLKNQVPAPSVSHCCISGVRAAGAGSLKVREATYGGNCGARRGNVTAHIAGQCDGKASCNYSVEYAVIGDPAPGCAKDYRVAYSCGPVDREGFAGPEAGYGSVVTLNCQ